MLLLHHALVRPDLGKRSRREKRDAINLGNRHRGKIEIGASGETCTHSLPADNGLLFYSATEAKWLAEPKLVHRIRRGPSSRAALRRDSLRSSLSNERRLVGSAGNAPVVVFQHCFVTAGLQTAGWITSRKNCLEMNSCDNLRTVKIHADKIEEGPPLALSRRDVRLIFETVPPDWTKEIEEVRIANSLEWHSHTFFARYDGCLTIYSRSKTKEQALTAVLSELAAISMRLDRGLKYRPKAVRDRLGRMTAPFMQKLLPLIALPCEAKGHVSLRDFKELRFPFVPNDVE